MENKNLYKTRDLGEAGALIVTGLKLLGIERVNNVCWFLFEDIAKCETISNKYFFGDLQISAITYKETLDRLKNRIFNKI